MYVACVCVYLTLCKQTTKLFDDWQDLLGFVIYFLYSCLSVSFAFLEKGMDFQFFVVEVIAVVGMAL